ncbi:potassium channel subfamily K member 13 [Octopus bimaculoides]|nr:potassium channel subfamily K member 13 [Octopus bimaculoides]
MPRPGNHGCFSFLHLQEDNARFLLLFIVMMGYLMFGAGIFMILESPNEEAERIKINASVEAFLERYPEANRTDLELLLLEYAHASAAGFVESKATRWDYVGSFYFVGTVVSTIGFGMTTPSTPNGKILLIFYGFFGCAGAILFFNLFLERIITFLAHILKGIHEKSQRQKSSQVSEKHDSERRDSSVSEDSLDAWKPSVYWVMLILLCGAILVACCASAMYHSVENWSYFESIYFCFVAFSTIGFGDYTVSQKTQYDYIHLYRLGNFVFIIIGCCCIYSLFNVASIIIKQFLNWILRKLNCRCQCRREIPTFRARRNAITPGIRQSQRKAKSDSVTMVDVDYDSDNEYRRTSGEMISMHDFLQAKNINIAMMQKRLWETAQRGMLQQAQNESGFHGGVGPLAILNRKLGKDEI